MSRYNREFINKKRAFGELAHPDGPTVNLERVSHMITSLTPDGKNFIGEAKIMHTPYGKIVKGLIDEGGSIRRFKSWYGVDNSAKRCKLCKR